MENVIAATEANGHAFGVADTVGGDLARKAGKAVLMTDNIEHLNKLLERAGENAIEVVGKGIEGLIAVKGGVDIRNKEEMEHRRDTGRRMRL